MHPIAFSLEFRGYSTSVSAGALAARGTVPAEGIVGDRQLGALFLHEQKEEAR